MSRRMYGAEYDDDEDYYNDPEFQDSEYLDEYLNSEARDCGISFSEYEEKRRIDDYGLTDDEADSGDED